MLKKDIKVRGHYVAKVGNNLTTVRVDAIREVDGFRGASSGRTYPSYTCYDVTNLKTGRKTTFRSAAKFRSVAKGFENVKRIGIDVADGPDRTIKAEVHVSEHGDVISVNEVDEDAPIDTTREERDEALAGKLVADRAKREDEQGSDPTTAKTTPSLISTSSGFATCDENTAPDQEPSNQASMIGDRTVPVDARSACPDQKTSMTTAIQTPNIAGRLATLEHVIPHEHPPTDEQQAILDAASQMTEGVLVIEAGAGTGKTSTLKMLEQVLKGVGQYTAFNASLVAESKAKFKRCSANTTHSLAFRAVGKQYAHRLNKGRVRAEDVAKMLGLGGMTVTVGANDDGTPRMKALDAGYLASQVMAAVRRFCQSADRQVSVDHFRYVDGIDMPVDGKRTFANNDLLKQRLLPFAHKVIEDVLSPTGVLPYSHDFYVKAWQLDRPVIAADYILLDEAQDTAPVMLDVLKQQKALVIVVGDSAQQIYEWRGAVNALAAFDGAPTKMLSQSFRFGQAIADVANAVLDSMMTPIQLRLKGLPTIASMVEAVERPRCVLTRTNAAAVQAVLTAIADGRKPHLIGGGAEMIKFVEAAQNLQANRPTSHPELALFSTWRDVQAYVKTDDGDDLKLMVKLVDGFGCQAILGCLRNMPEEKDADLVICTTHKSKGREWDTVRLGKDFPTNSKATDSDRRLLYVATTRAKLTLDLTECPFFTGKDALDVEPSEIMVPASAQVIPAATNGNPKPTPGDPPTKFTWSKSKDGDWLVRGPSGATGMVDVERQNGSKSKKTLGKSVWEGIGVALYQVGR